MKPLLLVFAALAAATTPTASTFHTPIPVQFESTGTDRDAIMQLLTTYTQAVSSKNQSQFETLLLNKAIPFSGAAAAVKAGEAEGGDHNYEDFRKGVFDGPPFSQRFQQIHIEQDGPVASVSLVFINTDSSGSTWGWKTLELLKTKQGWKIASEFFTGHA